MWDILTDLLWDLLRERPWLRRSLFIALSACLLATGAAATWFGLLATVFAICELDVWIRSRWTKK